MDYAWYYYRVFLVLVVVGFVLVVVLVVVVVLVLVLVNSFLGDEDIKVVIKFYIGRHQHALTYICKYSELPNVFCLNITYLSPLFIIREFVDLILIPGYA